MNVIKEPASFLNVPYSKEPACFEMGILTIFPSDSYHFDLQTPNPVFSKMIKLQDFLSHSILIALERANIK